MKMISNKPTRDTLQKRFVERYLLTHYDHPTAEEIYREAKKENLSIGLTTVYRILEGFLSEGKVVVIKSGGTIHYDWIRNDHYHFVCDSCGKIVDLRGDNDLLEGLCARHEFVLFSLQGVVIHGLCRACAEKGKKSILPKEEKLNGKRS
jgi:Fur family transcriptional regulator, peroxide stress response regulator